MHKPKAMAFDLDGTLAESKQRFSAEMGNILGELLAIMPVAIMSGASFPQFQKQFFPALPIDTKLENLYIFPVNAAQCYVHRQGDWKPQYDNSFTDKEEEEITSALKEALAEVGLADEPEKLWGDRIEDRGGAQVSFSPLGQQAPVEEKHAWAEKYNPLRIKLSTILTGKLPNFSVAMGGITTIDITQKGITKAYGVRRFSELCAVPLTDMLYVGDALGEGGNDSVVIETGIPTHAVFSPEETASFIETVIHKIH